jgi:hypothetical protein
VSLSDYLENAILNHIRGGAAFSQPSGIYVKLHTGDPGENGTANAAGETTRQQATFGSAASGGAISNTVAVSWTNVSTAETYSHVSLWDASTGGNCLGAGALAAAKTVAVGDNFTLPIGDLDFTLD